MGLFNFFGKSNEDKPEQQTEQQTEQQAEQQTEKLSRSEMKARLMKTLTENLTAHNFNKVEIKEVFDIIDGAEADIEKLKETLNQIKQTNANPTLAILKIKKAVEFIQQQMAADIKTKIRQIKLRKHLIKKERL